MTIKDFLNTTNGARYAAALAGCSGTWAVEYWESMDEYKACLIANGFNADDIAEQVEQVAKICYKTNKNDSDFVIVIN